MTPYILVTVIYPHTQTHACTHTRTHTRTTWALARLYVITNIEPTDEWLMNEVARRWPIYHHYSLRDEIKAWSTQARYAGMRGWRGDAGVTGWGKGWGRVSAVTHLPPTPHLKVGENGIPVVASTVWDYSCLFMQSKSTRERSLSSLPSQTHQHNRARERRRQKMGLGGMGNGYRTWKIKCSTKIAQCGFMPCNCNLWYIVLLSVPHPDTIPAHLHYDRPLGGGNVCCRQLTSMT